MYTVGVDEAGRGPVLGPLVVTACAIPKKDLGMLKDAGVKDSKDLSKKKRQDILSWYHEQSETRGWKHSVIVCTPERIDLSLQSTGLNWLEVEAFAEALSGLELEQHHDIINDACDVKPERFTERIRAKLQQPQLEISTMSSFHKADENYPIVGMASILAKETRDNLIDAMAQRIGQPLGSGYPSDPATVNALQWLITDDGIDFDVRWGWATSIRYWNAHCRGDIPLRGASHSFQKTLFD